jgi:hypothetical protein
MEIFDKKTAKFWTNRWINGRSIRELAPNLYECIPKSRRKLQTLADGLQTNNWVHDIHGILGVHEIWQYLQVCGNSRKSTSQPSLIN